MAKRFWRLDRAQVGGLRFVGAARLLARLDALLTRPRHWWRDRPLPVVRLHHDAADPSPLPGLRHRLDTARPHPVPHALVDESVTWPPARLPVRALVDELVGQLAAPVAGSPRLRFPHVGIVTWLLHLELRPTPTPDTMDRQIAANLRAHVARHAGLGAPDPDDRRELSRDFPWLVRLLVTYAPELSLRAFLRFWAVPRWVARHPITRPHGRHLYRLARQFAQRGLAAAAPGEVERFLVDALLADLRRAYGRRGLRRGGRHRLAYPVVLLDARVAGVERFADLVAAARRGTGRTPYVPDPLLLVVADPGPPTTAGADPAEVVYAHDEWRRALAHAGARAQWTLPFRLTGAPVPGAIDDLAALGHLRVRQPWFTRSRVGALLVLALVAVAARGVVLARAQAQESCGAPFAWTRLGDPDLYTRVFAPGPRPTVRGSTATECIGVWPTAVGTRPFRALSTDPLADDLNAAADAIAANNDAARGQPARTTIAYLGMLSATDPDDRYALREELRGIAVAQDDARAGPKVGVEVLLVNAGVDMAHAQDAAGLVLTVRDSGRPVDAVVGLGVSHTTTAAAVDDLERARMPMIGTLLSGDTFALSDRTHYYQVGPSNRRQTSVALRYLENATPTTHLWIVYSDEKIDSTYASELEADLRRAHRALFRPDRRPRIALQHPSLSFTPGEQGRTSPAEAGEQICALVRGTAAGLRPGTPFRPAIFYAGRDKEIRPFLGALAGCPPEARPHVLAADSVTRFVTGGGAHDFRDLTIDYLGGASGIVRCHPGFGGPGKPARAMLNLANGFRDAYQKRWRTSTYCADAADGQSGLAHDAVLLHAKAYATVSGDARPRPAELLKAVYETGQRLDLAWATGFLLFAQTSRVREPDRKAVLVLRAMSAGTAEGGTGAYPQPRYACGLVRTAPDRAEACVGHDGHPAR
ncbi:hypothetical protein GCM10010124_28840 [Pilimelia terevasa]|uniref:Uncharacterized protein n=1 Tax=Pilimelia terevasa TaxID=53372 RepID=A0A8J3BTU6_9ACTN|nr:hypothetical protein [Pilimelia terevasa]GGK34457.1 hypothetical protein GCM10010124_28840 [Pilimelia terevasa]